MRVFVAGATGAVGKRLMPRLIGAGHQVTGTTRSPEKLQWLEAQGANGVVIDGLDEAGIARAVGDARPDVIVHQLTALAGSGSNLKRFDDEFTLTNRLRTTGLDYLLSAARTVGVKRFIAQSFTGWTNIREGGPVKTEDDPLDPDPPARMRQTLGAIRYLERTITAVPDIQGVAMRYGFFYGPGTSLADDAEFASLIRRHRFPLIGDGSGVWSFTHIDDAATATVAALTKGAAGVYNIVDDDPAPVHDWLPYLAKMLDAKPPMHVPAWIGRIAAGDVGVSMMTRIRGSSNSKAKRDLQWRPAFPSWRDGFRSGLSHEALERHLRLSSC